MRDDFSEESKRVIANRAGNRCSRPSCRALTSGPQVDPIRALNVGVAAHITAASAGGPRFDPILSSAKRRHPHNGIWLCQTCAKLLDNDPLRFPADELRRWKRETEDEALSQIGRAIESPQRSDPDIAIRELLKRIPSRAEPLSAYLAEALALAQQLGFKMLELFAARELVGWYGVAEESRPLYRTVSVYISATSQVNPQYYGWSGNSDVMLRAMENEPEDFKPVRMFFPNPVSDFEVDRPQDPRNSLMFLTMRLKDFHTSTESPDLPVFVYGSGLTYRNILDGVRTALTKQLVEAISDGLSSSVLIS